MPKRGDKLKMTDLPSLPDDFNILTTPIFLFEDELVTDNISSIIDHDFRSTNFTEDSSQEMTITSDKSLQELDINRNPSNDTKKKPTVTEIRTIKPTDGDYNAEYELHSMNRELHQKVDINSNVTNRPQTKPTMTKNKVPEPKTTSFSIKTNRVVNQENLVEAATKIREPESNKSKLSIEEQLVNVHRLLAAVNVNLTSINNRLAQMATGSVEQHVCEAVWDVLPLVGPEGIQILENILKKNKDNEVAQFKKLVLRIGGDSRKNNIQRVLKKIFTNYCAAHSTWMGKRENNTGINNLLAIQIIRDVLCSSHTTLKERDFDKITAEWFRFGKQRWLRELQAKGKATGENESTNTKKVQI